MDAALRLVTEPGTPRSSLVAEQTLLPEKHRRKRNGKERGELRSYFSPHLEKIPHRFYLPPRGKRAGNMFRDDGGAVARLLIEAYDGDPNKVEKAARLARRTLEMLEFEMQSNHGDCFVDAAGSGQLQHVLKMLRQGQDVDVKHSSTGYSALHAAADFGHLDVIKALLKHGADLHCLRTSDDGTALQCAAENGHAPVVRYLVLDAGSDKLRANRYGLIAYDYACFQNHNLVADILREPPKQIAEVLTGDKLKLTSRSVEVQWDIPDDHGVRIIEYEVSFAAVAGTEVRLFPEREGVICRIVVDANKFGPNPHRARKDAERAKLKRQMEADKQIEAERMARARARNSGGDAGGNNDALSDSDEDEEELARRKKALDEELADMERTASEAVALLGSHASHLFDDNLMPATKYAITIRSRSVAGWSKPSDRVTFVTLPDVPGAPSRVTMADTGATCASMDVLWKPPFSNNGRIVATYEVQVQRVKLKSTKAREGNISCAEKLPLDEDSSEQQDAEGGSSQCTTKENQAICEQGECFTVVEDWQKVREDVVASAIKLVNQTSGNMRIEQEFDPVAFTIDKLRSGSAFRVRVRAKNQVGYGEFSKPSKAIFTRPATVATGVWAKKLEVDWNASVDSATEAKGVLRWTVQRSVPPSAKVVRDPDSGEIVQVIEDEQAEPVKDFDWRTATWITVSDSIPGAQRRTTLANLCPATMYFVRVKPVFVDKEKNPSPEWSRCAVSLGLVTKQATPEEPLAPVVVQPDIFEDNLADITHDSIKITWKVPRDNGTPVEAFTVRFTKNQIGNWQIAMPLVMERTLEGAPDIDPGYCSRRITGLDPGTGYKFAVKARNAVGWGPFSSPSALIRTRPAGAPGIPRFVMRTDSIIKLEWEQGGIFPDDTGGAESIDVSNAIKLECYEVQLQQLPKAGDDNNQKFQSGKWEVVQPTPLTSTNEISAHDLLPVTPYKFRVRAKIVPSSSSTVHAGEWTNFSLEGGPFKTTRRF